MPTRSQSGNTRSAGRLAASRALPLAAAVLSAGVLLSGPARAEGFYLGGNLGVGLPGDGDVTGDGIDTSIDFEPGTVAVLSAGYTFDNGFRSELELAGRWNDADTVSGSSGSGDTRAISGMFNALYDVALDSAITPYVGVGLGAAQIKDSGIASVNGSSIGDDDTVFAYQALAGFSYDLNDMWSITADYRYFASDDASLATAAGATVEQSYRSHAILLGIRFSLGGVAATMPPTDADSSGSAALSAVDAPASMPIPEPDTSAAAADMAQTAAVETETTGAGGELSRSYRILFDWDKKALNPLAINTIAAIAMSASDGGVIRIQATGHADRSGPEVYNETLSRARAEEVQQALVRLGVPADRIMIDWRGETDPAVPTADGVREQQNRRVEIVFPSN